MREFGTTKEGVVRREGLALFVSERKTDDIVIPFVATYEFGTPRQPKYPWKGGSVFSVDEEPEPEVVEPKTPEEIEEERVALWKVECLYKDRVLETFKIHGAQLEANDKAADAFNDEISFLISEVKDPTVE